MAISFVQYTNTSGTNSLAYTSNNQVDDLLVAVFCFTDFGTNQIATCTDTRGNQWVRLASTVLSDPTTPPVQIELWYAQDSRAGANTVSVTWTGGGPATVSIDIAEYKGVTLGGNPVNTVATAKPAGLSPSVGPYTVTVNSVIVAYVAPVGNATAGDANSNFRGSNPIGCGYEDRIVSPGSYSSSFSVDAGPNLIFAVAFQETSGNAILFGMDF